KNHPERAFPKPSLRKMNSRGHFAPPLSKRSSRERFPEVEPPKIELEGTFCPADFRNGPLESAFRKSKLRKSNSRGRFAPPIFEKALSRGHFCDSSLPNALSRGDFAPPGFEKASRESILRTRPPQRALERTFRPGILEKGLPREPSPPSFAQKRLSEANRGSRHRQPLPPWARDGSTFATRVALASADMRGLFKALLWFAGIFGVI